MTVSIDLSELVGNAIVGIVIAVTSSWVTVQLSLRKFRTEKWWERKVAAYERVIEALHDVRLYVRMLYEVSTSGKSIRVSRVEELQAKADQAQLELAKAIDVGAYSMSPEAYRRLLQFQDEQIKIQELLGEESNVQKAMEMDLASTESCLDDLIRLAKKDLGIS